MLYRKASPRPPRLLLRIAATAGASALLGVAACSSSSDSVAPSGAVVSPPADDAGDAASNPVTIMTGIMANPDATVACGGGPCGSVVMSQDGGDAGDFAPDAENDAGSMDATDDVTHCGGVCGVIVRPDQ
ncbi:MAG TPA: hypothetical protein VK762_05100 [Polyangiaceae bacterium]|nr:hypothetical protein [Polyangiaceae bacterium]